MSVSHLDYDALLHLFSHRHTANLYMRQAAAFRQIAREKAQGLTMSDIHPTCSIILHGLDVLGSMSAQDDKYIRPLGQLIQLIGKDFVKKKAYEEFDNVHALKSILKMLSACLESSHAFIIQSCTSTILSFIDERHSGNVQANELAQRYQLIYNSNLVHILVDCLVKHSHDLSIAVPLIQTCHALSHIETIVQLFDNHIFETLIELMEMSFKKNGFRDTLIMEIIQLLSFILERSNDAIVAFTTSQSMRILSLLTTASFEQGHCMKDKTIRNELVILTTIIIRVPSCHRLLVECGMLSLFLAHSGYIEQQLCWRLNNNTSDMKKTHTVGLQTIRHLRNSSVATTNKNINEQAANHAPEFTQSTCHEDFELKLLLWGIISSVISDPLCHSLIVQSEFTRVLFIYLDAAQSYNDFISNISLTDLLSSLPPDITSCDALSAWHLCRRWNLSQLMELMHYALKTLTNMVEYIDEALISLHGVSRLLAFIVCIVQPAGNEKSLCQASCVQLQSLAVACLLKTIVAHHAIKAATASNASSASNTGDAIGISPSSGSDQVELEELLDVTHDEAFQAAIVLMSPVPPTKTAHRYTFSFGGESSSFLIQSPSHSSSSSYNYHTHLFNILLEIFRSHSSIETRANAIETIAVECRNSAEARDLFREMDCVPLVIAFLSDLSTLQIYAAKSPKILIAITDVIWSCIFPSQTNTQLFLLNNGMDHILNLLAICPTLMRKQVLSVLTDFLSLSQTHRFLYEWQSPQNIPLPTNNNELHEILQQQSKSYLSTTKLATPFFNALQMILSLWPEPNVIEREVRKKEIRINKMMQDDDEDEEEDGGATTNTDDDMSPPVSPSSRSSRITSRLSSQSTAQQREENDAAIKAVIYALFTAIEWKWPDATDVQTATMREIKQYHSTLLAKSLANIEEKLQSTHIQPVDQDSRWLNEEKERLQVDEEETRIFATEQYKCHQLNEQQEMANYFDTIVARSKSDALFVISQQRRNQNLTMRRRLLYKEMRAQMLHQSFEGNEQQLPASSNNTQGSPAKKKHDLYQAHLQHDLEEQKQSLLSDDDDELHRELEERLLQDLTNHTSPLKNNNNTTSSSFLPAISSPPSHQSSTSSIQLNSVLRQARESQQSASNSIKSLGGKSSSTHGSGSSLHKSSDSSSSLTKSNSSTINSTRTSRRNSGSSQKSLQINV